jgi:hypothetical protein
MLADVLPTLKHVTQNIDWNTMSTTVITYYMASLCFVCLLDFPLLYGISGVYGKDQLR